MRVPLLFALLAGAFGAALLTQEVNHARHRPIALRPADASRATTLAPMSETDALSHAVNEYLREPTPERAGVVWEAFAAADEKVDQLSKLVVSEVGGQRAEAEVERIETQRARDKEMSRFLSTQQRMNAAYAALEALTRSIEEGKGIESAAAILAHDSNSAGARVYREIVY